MNNRADTDLLYIWRASAGMAENHYEYARSACAQYGGPSDDLIYQLWLSEASLNYPLGSYRYVRGYAIDGVDYLGSLT